MIRIPGYEKKGENITLSAGRNCFTYVVLITKICNLSKHVLLRGIDRPFLFTHFMGPLSYSNQHLQFHPSISAFAF